MTAASRLPPVRRASLSVVSMGGGIALAAVPAAVLSIASHTFPTAQLGYVSVTVTASTFVSQLASAAIVEARLGAVGGDRHVGLPRWLGGLGLAAAVVLTVLFDNPVVLCACLPFLLSALEVGRSVAVSERLDLREIWAAVALGAGTLGGLAVAFLGGGWGLAPVAVGIAAATLLRLVRAPRPGARPPAAVTFWVVTDVGLTGVIYPLLNAVVLAVLGPVGSVLFAAISTVSGLLSIPLNFMRLRLLKAHSAMDIGVSIAAVGFCAVVIGVLEFTGILGFVYAGPWTIPATLAPLAIACLWRAASIASTLPFASLRRAGHVRLLTILRGICAAATFVVGVATLPWHSLAVIFAVLLLGELAQAVVYEIARRRRVASGGAS